MGRSVNGPEGEVTETQTDKPLRGLGTTQKSHQRIAAPVNGWPNCLPFATKLALAPIISGDWAQAAIPTESVTITLAPS